MGTMITGIFTAVSGAPTVSAAFMRAAERLRATDGVVYDYPSAGAGLLVSPGTGLAVNVAEGGIFLGGAAGILEEGGGAQSVAVSAYGGAGTRLDYIIAQLDLTVSPNTLTLAHLPGTSGAYPTLTNSSTVKQKALAKLALPTGVTSILAGYLTDTRADATLCGYARPRLYRPAELAYPVDTGPGAGGVLIELVADVDGDTEAVPVGKQWWIEGFFFDGTVATWSAADQQARMTNSSGPVLFTYANPGGSTGGLSARLDHPLPLDAGEVVWFQQAGMGLYAREVDADTGRHAVHVELTTDAAGLPVVTYTVPTGERLIVLACQVTGGVLPGDAYLEHSGSTYRPQYYDIIQGFHQTTHPQPARPVIFLGGDVVQARAGTATAVNYYMLHGYREVASDTRRKVTA